MNFTKFPRPPAIINIPRGVLEGEAAADTTSERLELERWEALDDAAVTGEDDAERLNEDA